jgi:hypothetical protein
MNADKTTDLDYPQNTLRITAIRVGRRLHFKHPKLE